MYSATDGMFSVVMLYPLNATTQALSKKVSYNVIRMFRITTNEFGIILRFCPFSCIKSKALYFQTRSSY